MAARVQGLGLHLIDAAALGITLAVIPRDVDLDMFDPIAITPAGRPARIVGGAP